jgi:hypothetical protein
MKEAKKEVYIELFHGRTPKDQQMDDFGMKGPIFGPFFFVHTTYGDHIKLGHEEGSDFLRTDDNMIYYDGIWYGDWSVFTANALNYNYEQEAEEFWKRLVPFCERKAAL